jgi:hypothetical protein
MAARVRMRAGMQARPLTAHRGTHGGRCRRWATVARGRCHRGKRLGRGGRCRQLGHLLLARKSAVRFPRRLVPQQRSSLQAGVLHGKGPQGQLTSCTHQHFAASKTQGCMARAGACGCGVYLLTAHSRARTGQLGWRWEGWLGGGGAGGMVRQREQANATCPARAAAKHTWHSSWYDVNAEPTPRRPGPLVRRLVTAATAAAAPPKVAPALRVPPVAEVAAPAPTPAAPTPRPSPRPRPPVDEKLEKMSASPAEAAAAGRPADTALALAPRPRPPPVEEKPLKTSGSDTAAAAAEGAGVGAGVRDSG